jgi:RNA polymerase sigma-70 factor (ECF subfamily)
MGITSIVTGSAYDRFALFYAAHSRVLWRYLVRIGANSAVAEDLVQEAFVRWSLSPAADWDGPRSRAYLFTTATRLLTDWWRRERRHISWDDAGVSPSVAEVSASPLFQSRAWRALSQRQQQLLWLAYVEEFTHDEIAAISGVSSKSVRVLLSRARDLVSNHLESEEYTNER